MKTIFNTKNVDAMSQPLFLGKDLGVQRFDINVASNEYLKLLEKI